jgi:hypothetical protein
MMLDRKNRIWSCWQLALQLRNPIWSFFRKRYLVWPKTFSERTTTSTLAWTQSPLS